MRAIESVPLDSPHTRDIGGTVSTQEVGAAIAARSKRRDPAAARRLADASNGIANTMPYRDERVKATAEKYSDVRTVPG
jgi:hypothetical protein